MTNFEVLSNEPISDQVPNRELARRLVAAYRDKKLHPSQEAPPVGSIRRVYWAANLNSKRTVIERIESRVKGLVERLVL